MRRKMQLVGLLGRIVLDCKKPRFKSKPSKTQRPNFDYRHPICLSDGGIWGGGGPMGLGLTRPGLADEVPLTSGGSPAANACGASTPKRGDFPGPEGRWWATIHIQFPAKLPPALAN